MSTISVPLSAELEEKLQGLIDSGYGSNKADVVRRALVRISEEKEIEDILKSMNEPSLKGDLRTLASKIK